MDNRCLAATGNDYQQSQRVICALGSKADTARVRKGEGPHHSSHHVPQKIRARFSHRGQQAPSSLVVHTLAPSACHLASAETPSITPCRARLRRLRIQVAGNIDLLNQVAWYYGFDDVPYRGRRDAMERYVTQPPRPSRLFFVSQDTKDKQKNVQ
jgi:hypothetical protein